MSEGSLSVLVVEDDSIIGEVIQLALESAGHHPRQVTTGQLALQALEQDWPDILILDRMLPDVDGVELCARVRELQPDAPYLPILVLTALQTAEHKTRAFEHGADDYITKPFDVEELLARVRVWGRTGRRVREVYQLRELYQQSQNQALSDALTGLHNRRGLESVLEQESEKARRLGYTLGLLIIDVDYFKSVNDWRGHQAGDKTLRAVAQALRQALRKTDVLARYGGDEFVALLPGCSLGALASVGEQLRQAVAEHRGAESPAPAVTVSIGGSVVPGRVADAARLFAAADAALYEAKAQGRNRVVVGDGPPATEPSSAANIRGRPTTAMDRRRADPLLRDVVEHAEPYLEQYGFHLDGRGSTGHRERSWVEFHRPDDEAESAADGVDGETVLLVGHRRRSHELLVDAYHVDADLEHEPRHKHVRSYEEASVPDVVGYVVDVARELPKETAAPEDGGAAEAIRARAEPTDRS
jgi:two-component system, cell cycle response regulator